MDTPSFNIIGFVDDDRQKYRKSIPACFNVLDSHTSAQLFEFNGCIPVSDIVVAINGEIEGAA